MTSTDARLVELYHRLQKIYVLLDDGDRRALATVGLTPTHYNLLRLLDGGGRSVTQLAELMLCTRGNITRLVRRLLDAGLVRTGSDPADQRVVWVFPTPLGRDRLAAAHTVFTATNRRRFGSLPEEDVERLYELTGDLAELLTKQCHGQR